MTGKLLNIFVFIVAFGFYARAGNSIVFTENKGQWGSGIAYRADLDGGKLFIEKDRFVFNLYDKKTLHDQHISNKKEILPIRSHSYSVLFQSSNTSFIETKNPVSAYSNFFIGNDKTRWASNVKSYSYINYLDMYPGINMEVIGKDNSIKYNFIVKKGSDPSVISMKYEGVDGIKLNDKGELVITTSISSVTEQAPVAYQVINGVTVNVPCRFELTDNVVSFKMIRGYDKSYDLVIDPVLVFSSFSGSTADNFGMTATYDAQGNLYSGGTTFDIGYPVTAGAYDPSYNGIVANGRTDVVITKYDSSGSFLQYSTYLGGANGTEVVSSLIVNEQDELYLYGATGSSDFPMGLTFFDNTFNGGTSLNYVPNGTIYQNGTDIYVARFNSDGTSLLASTYIGGTLNDGVNSTTSLAYNYGDYYRGEIMLDDYGNCYVASCTYSSNFPVSSNAFQALSAGGLEGCVFKFNPDLNSLLYSSYLGGPIDDACYAIAVDSRSNAYVTGGTNSTAFPVTSNAYSTAFNGGQSDGFITRIDSAGSSIVSSSYIGTTAYDQSYFVQLDKQQNVYLLGQTLGPFPVSPGVYSNPNSGQFIIKLDDSLSTSIYSTVFGNGSGQVNISPSAFLVDHCGNVYVSGWGGHILNQTPTTGMPLTTDAFQSTTDGFNFYLMVLEKDLASLLYATYFGGPVSQEHVDGGTSRFDKRGIVYQSVCAGCNGNSDFPTTPGAWSSTNNNSNCNNGVFKFDFEFRIASAEFTSSTLEGCAPLTVQFESMNSAGSSSYWDFGNGDTSSLSSPIRTFYTPGTYYVDLIAIDSASCNVRDTARKIIIVHEGVIANFSLTNDFCSDSVFVSDSSFSPSGVQANSWLYNFGDGAVFSGNDTSHIYNSPGTYTVSLIAFNIAGCSDTILKPVTIEFSEASATPLSTCDSTRVNFVNSGAGNSFFWDFGLTGSVSDTLSSAGNVSYVYPDTGVYVVSLIAYSSNGVCNDTLTFPVEVNPNPVADFSFSINNCDTSVTFLNTSQDYGLPITYSWSFDDGNTSSMPDPSHDFPIPSSYNVQLIVSGPACNDTIVKVISFTPINAGAKGDTIVCPGSSQVELSAFGGSAYTWNPGDFLTDIHSANHLITPLNSVNYTVSITVSQPGMNDCFLYKNVTVQVSNSLINTLSASANDHVILEGESVQLVADPTNFFTYSWTPLAGLSSGNQPEVTATPAISTTYSVLATDQYGCTAMDTVFIKVIKNSCEDTDFFVPNTFTPNGDLVNDIFRVRGDVKEVYLAVYNRWGEKVYETNDKNQGWDGTYKGMNADPAVFAYYVKILCYSGTEFIKKGNVTLIR